jgi:hypothetical protein
MSIASSTILMKAYSQSPSACLKGANTGSRGHHSITSSARTSSDDGTVNPSALAVLRSIASWYFVGACAGRLAGFSPFEDVSHRGVVAEQDFDDHRLDGYHSSSIHSLGIRGRALAYGD